MSEAETIPSPSPVPPVPGPPASSAQLPAFTASSATRPGPKLSQSPPLPQIQSAKLAARLTTTALSTAPPHPPDLAPDLPRFITRSQSRQRPTSGKTGPELNRGLRAKRLAILGIGLGLLAGAFARGRTRDGAPPAIASPSAAVATVLPVPTPSPPPKLTLNSKTAARDLQQQLQQLAAQTPNLRLGAVFYDIDRGTHASIAADETFPTASTIKVPILVALFQAVDDGRIKLDEELTLRQDLMASGSGTLQHQPVGTKISVLEAATMTISISDNTATNLLIDRFGGIELLNQQFQRWGLKQTRLLALLPDLAGTNVTSPADMTLLLAQIEKGALLDRRSRDRLLDIMRRTRNDSLLPQGLGPQARIAHKTGNIRSLVGDIGLIDLPNGRRYVAAVMVQRAIPNDPAADRLIQQVSKVARDRWMH